MPEWWGSSSISAATTFYTCTKGNTFTAKLRILSWFSEMMCENTSPTANFANSLGCRVHNPGSTSHRLQPLYSGIKSTTTSSTSEAPSSGQANLWKM